jgi:hypothetical protein
LRPADMTDEELKIAASTPLGQLKAAGILRAGPAQVRGGRSSMIVHSLESVSGSRLLCPAVVIK